MNFSTAFDSIEHNELWEALQNQVVNKKVIRILENVCSREPRHISKRILNGKLFERKEE